MCVFVYDYAYVEERTAKNVVGAPFKADTFQGPQSSKEAGSKVETGGERHGEEGYFIQPTIFSNVSEDMKIMQAEIFGPVCALSKFKTEEEVIRLGNETTYGFAAAVHTTNLSTAIRVANALKAGTVWVKNDNMLSYQVPFGGFKESGIGRGVWLYACEGPRYLVSTPVTAR
ncbi:hypothetical protein Z517_09378 [Fonsecaea pedrosoi CBS 271.37]|uniref:aldehyde dehydrogenase (NAD(+)) n=1 Tax=Fonsecaea pedrosoi CBS 271.37 TaxID=1442368 RepID=A0A0D2GX80_9EURO|nr:uncharacterized protein Z517_09378 [Fonsecaea pedrosoi CBS 271.37]KIW76934.1 hypothetical protein Z517_09378 [Fonsecaea pedrosoi CBS 271.37]